MKIDFNKKMEEIIESFSGEKKSLLLHSCCAPCNTGVLQRLNENFHITVYFYNPNVNVPGEFERRYEEQRRFIEESGIKAELIKGDFIPQEFFDAVKGHEHDGEKSIRCIRCFDLRLKEAARKAEELHMDYFASSLTVSPMKDSDAINQLGYKWSEIYKTDWLPSDFKKKGGYQCSVNLSKEFNLYRQNYCGCSFSKAESFLREQEKLKKNSLQSDS